MNRRENGLSADAYTPLIDLVAELADDLLELLREAGIAAYALPGAGDEPDLLDRVHVDQLRKEEAERVLHERILGDRIGPAATATDPGALSTATAEPLDDDAIFAQIVAGFGDTPADVRWPDEENVRPEPDEDDDPVDRTGAMPTARVVFSAEPAQAEEMPEPDEDGHYEPPPPPPLPTGDSTTRLAWLCLVGGPSYILVTVLLGWDSPGWAAFMAVAAFIGGFVTLVLRMGDEPRDGDDDGAVI
ncbi:hypothetical protein [Actinocorallia lasiicapitis]